MCLKRHKNEGISSELDHLFWMVSGRTERIICRSLKWTVFQVNLEVIVLTVWVTVDYQRKKRKIPSSFHSLDVQFSRLSGISKSFELLTLHFELFWPCSLPRDPSAEGTGRKGAFYLLTVHFGSFSLISNEYAKYQQIISNGSSKSYSALFLVFLFFRPPVQTEQFFKMLQSSSGLFQEALEDLECTSDSLNEFKLNWMIFNNDFDNPNFKFN